MTIQRTSKTSWALLGLTWVTVGIPLSVLLMALTGVEWAVGRDRG